MDILPLALDEHLIDRSYYLYMYHTSRADSRPGRSEQQKGCAREPRQPFRTDDVSSHVTAAFRNREYASVIGKTFRAPSVRGAELFSQGGHRGIVRPERLGIKGGV